MLLNISGINRSQIRLDLDLLPQNNITVLDVFSKCLKTCQPRQALQDLVDVIDGRPDKNFPLFQDVKKIAISFIAFDKVFADKKEPFPLKRILELPSLRV